MPKFKQFLQEMIQFNFGVHYVDKDGEDKSVTIKATTQSDALNKFKANDKVKDYKNILQIRKGEPVPPNEVNEDLNKNPKKYYLVVIKNYKGTWVHSCHTSPGKAFHANIPWRLTNRKDFEKKIVVSDIKKEKDSPMPDISTLENYEVGWADRMKG